MFDAAWTSPARRTPLLARSVSAQSIAPENAVGPATARPTPIRSDGLRPCD
jgi:hypothetical protein